MIKYNKKTSKSIYNSAHIYIGSKESQNEASMIGGSFGNLYRKISILSIMVDYLYILQYGYIFFKSNNETALFTYF